MNSKMGFGSTGTRLIAIAITSLAAISGFANAQTIATVNGAEIDTAVFDVYIQGRLQDPSAQLTDEQLAGLLNQLKDVYMLANQEATADIRQDPIVRARLELQEVGVLAQAYIDQYLTNLNITDEEIAAEYAAQISRTPLNQYKVRHILVATQGEAIEIIVALIAGANFSELAKERSSDTSAASGGSLDWFAPTQMVAPFSDAVIRLEDGRYTTDPVQTDYGWHVILREGSRDTEPPPLEGVRDQIVGGLQTQKLQDHLTQLRSQVE